MALKKLLKDLKVSELKSVLEERECETDGKKSILQARLRDVLIEEGEDPDTFCFELEGDLDSCLHKLDDNLNNLNSKIIDLEVNLEEKISDKIMENSQDLINILEDKIIENSKDLQASFNDKILNLEESLNNKIIENSTELQDKITEIEEDVNRKIEILKQEIEKANSPKCQETSEAPKLVENKYISKSVIKPPQFDGKTAWANYFCQFEAAARANGWTIAEKATALTVALRGDATDILQTLSPSEQGDYQQLVRHLEMRYGQAHLEHVYHSQLKNRIQKSNESLQEFEADVARLVRLAYPATPENVMERLAVQAFSDGLRDNETRQALLLAHPTHLVDALARALEFEAAKQSSRSLGRVRAIDECSDESVEGIVRKVMDQYMGKKGPIRCWNCGQVGHVRSRCKEKNEEPAPSRSENY